MSKSKGISLGDLKTLHSSAVEQLSNWASGDFTTLDTDYGICWNLDRILRAGDILPLQWGLRFFSLENLMMLWEGHSGDRFYPVRHEVFESEAAYSMAISKWASGQLPQGEERGICWNLKYVTPAGWQFRGSRLRNYYPGWGSYSRDPFYPIPADRPDREASTQYWLSTPKWSGRQGNLRTAFCKHLAQRIRQDEGAADNLLFTYPH